MISTVIDTQVQIISIPNMPIFKIRATPYPWDEVVDIVRTNHLERFARLEEESKRYLAYKHKVAEDKISVFKYLLINQLQWAKYEDIKDKSDSEISIKAKSHSFLNGDDLKVLKNDFPYNFESNVVHLCIWTKFRIPVDPNSAVGDISQETRDLIEKYLKKTFCEYVPWENILWFKNWESLQSVKNLSHIHVLIKDMDEEALGQILYTPGKPLTVEELE